MIKNRGGNAACFSYIHICRIKIIHAVLDESLPQYVAFFSVVLLQADTLLSATVFLSIRKLFPPIPQKKEPGDGSIYREKEESHGCKQEWMKIKNSLITQSTSKRDLPTNPLYTNQYERGTQKTDNVCWFSPILPKTFLDLFTFLSHLHMPYRWKYLLIPRLFTFLSVSRASAYVG